MLTVSGLRKAFPDSDNITLLFDNLNLAVEKAECVAIMGPSGCGKSSLLHMIASLLPVDQGTITLNTENAEIHIEKLNASQADEYRRRVIGIVFQRYNLIDYINVRENIMLPAKLNQINDPAYLESLYDKLDIRHLLNKKPVQLSGGEQQRVAIARALAHKPKLLLADEPTGNLDPKTSEKVSKLLTDVCRDTLTSMIMVTHSPDVAAKNDRTLLLQNQQLIEAN